IGGYGGAVLDEDENVVVDSPETVTAIEKMQEIVDSDFVPDNILNFTEIETESSFIEGEAVYARNWPYLQASSNDEEKSEVAGKDRKSTRLNSSHVSISYAVFCLKK